MTEDQALGRIVRAVESIAASLDRMAKQQGIAEHQHAAHRERTRGTYLVA